MRVTLVICMMLLAGCTQEAPVPQAEPEPPTQPEPEPEPEPSTNETMVPAPPPVDLWLEPGDNQLTLNWLGSAAGTWEFILGVNATAEPQPASWSPPHAVVIVPWDHALDGCNEGGFWAHSGAGDEDWLRPVPPGVYRVIVAEGSDDDAVAGTGIFPFHVGGDEPQRSIEPDGRPSPWNGAFIEREIDVPWASTLAPGLAHVGVFASNSADAEEDRFASTLELQEPCSSQELVLRNEVGLSFGDSGSISHLVASNATLDWRIDHDRTERVPGAAPPTTRLNGVVFIPPGF